MMNDTIDKYYHHLKDGDLVEILPNYYFYNYEHNPYIFDNSIDTNIELKMIMLKAPTGEYKRTYRQIISDDNYRMLFLELRAHGIRNNHINLEHLMNKTQIIAFALLNGQIKLIRYGFGLQKIINKISFNSDTVYNTLRVSIDNINENLKSYDKSYIDTNYPINHINTDYLFNQYKELGLIEHLDKLIENNKISNNITHIYNTLKFYNDPILEKDIVKQSLVKAIRAEKLKNIFQNE